MGQRGRKKAELSLRNAALHALHLGIQGNLQPEHGQNAVSKTQQCPLQFFGDGVSAGIASVC